MKVASQQGISLSELEMINGTGANGRVTKKDLQNYIASNADSNLTPIKKQSVKPELLKNIQSGEKVQLDHMRRKISEHMRYSLNTSAPKSAIIIDA